MDSLNIYAQYCMTIFLAYFSCHDINLNNICVHLNPLHSAIQVGMNPCSIGWPATVYSPLGRQVNCILLFGKRVCHISTKSLADGDVCAPRMQCGPMNIKIWVTIYLMKQQFIVTHRYTTLHETEGTWQTADCRLQIARRPTLKHVMFLHKHKNCTVR
jgi:hypothetical protein